MKHHVTLIKKDSKSWFVFLLIGTVFIVAGCYTLLCPFTKYASVARVFGILALLTGIIKIVFSFKHRQVLSYWQRHIAIGISDTLIGIFLITFQGFSTLILPFILSFWILSGGIAVSEEAADIKIFHTSDTDWMIIGGAATLSSLFIIAYLPLLGSLAVMLSTVTFLIIIGVFYLILALKLKLIRKELHHEEIYLKSLE